MAFNPNNPNGSATSANSQPVVIASDQSAIPVSNPSLVSTLNSSTAALGIGGVFTGTSENVADYAEVRIVVFTDQVSATDGLSVQQSPDGTNWDIIDTLTVPASTGKTYGFGISARFYRIVYTNGGTANTVFRLQSVLHRVRTKPSSVRPQDGRGNDNDFEENLAYTMLYNGTSWDRGRGTTANGLAVDVTRVPANQSVNISQINGVAPSVGSGINGTGVQRVTIATDQAAVPVSGTVTANIGTSTLALDATLTGGTQKAITRGGAKGTTVAADVTSTIIDANTQSLDVSVKGSAAVTGPLTNTELRATAVPVSAASLPLPAGASTETTLAALNTKVTAVNTGAVTVSTALPTGANTIGAISNTSFIATQATPANLQATVTNITLTKGTQGATGATTQDLKDAGRNQSNYFMAAQIISTAGEVLQSLAGYKAGAAVAATTTPAVVTTGKIYRISSIVITYVAVATAGSIQVNLRANTAGLVAIGSPLVASWLVGGPAAVAGTTQTLDVEITDGMEFAAGTGLGLTVLGVGATGTAAIVGYAKISMTGYEY